MSHSASQKNIVGQKFAEIRPGIESKGQVRDMVIYCFRLIRGQGLHGFAGWLGGTGRREKTV